jgi:heptose-I-phosphate ethanolaminephosphotransferase
MQALLSANAKLPPLKNLVDAHADQPGTLVLVLGESTNRQRMSLYGYPRATTPRLDAMRDQLAVFDNVVTPRPYTIEALQQVLTFADEQNPDAYLTTPSIVNLMKQAGYKTFWITNQQTMTERNTMLTTFSEQADEQVYLNNNREQNTRQYDGDVLAPFSKALADPAPRKFIVVHLLGTHMSYKYRFPEEYDHFKDRQGAPEWVTDDQLPTYNSYDNAVLYNDFVVSRSLPAVAEGTCCCTCPITARRCLTLPRMTCSGAARASPLRRCIPCRSSSGLPGNGRGARRPIFVPSSAGLTAVPT